MFPERKGARYFLLWVLLCFAPAPASAGPESEAVAGYREIDLPEAPHLRVLLSRTSAMSYDRWLADGRERGGASGAAEELVAGEDVPGVVRFALDLPSPRTPVPVARVLPRPIAIESGDEVYPGLEFVRRKSPSANRVLYFLEHDAGDGWERVAQPREIRLEDAGAGFERVVVRDARPAGADPPRQLRLVLCLQPAPTLFAHYMSDLNPGWSAMGYLMQPEPAYLRLFHDDPARARPIPPTPLGRFPSTGGVHRDLPLLPPGFLFSSAVESARLEIRRARRAGVDGFAVNCLAGKTEILEALYRAAADVYREDAEEPPFLIALSIDINVLPHEDRKLLVTVAELIRTWLRMGEAPPHRRHLARRGGMPLVMGYQSHWIWFDYLQRLLELWELEDGARLGWSDSRLLWPEELGESPPTPVLPPEVIAEYRRKRLERLGQLPVAA